MSKRIETDSMGDIEVDAERLWGAQTQRSLEHFRISGERMPRELVAALVSIKRVAAQVNRELGSLEPRIAGAIEQAAAEVLGGRLLDDEFPLVVWQTGSGTQTNMNVNEVLANHASELLGGARGQQRLVHPNDHVNMGQSSNDVFPTAMHVAAAIAVARRLLPALEALRAELAAKAAEYADLVKIGRTHLQDATPLTLGQELSGYEAQLGLAIDAIAAAVKPVHALAQGGTAVGTGLNTHPEFGARVAAKLAAQFDVSRTTVRQALAELTVEGRLLRVQGKGTFVAKPKVAQLLELASYTEGMRAHGLHPQTKILDIGYVTADEPLAELIGVRPGGRALRIHRLRLADGEPMSIDTSHLPARRFPGLRKQLERHRSLYETLGSAYGIQLAEAQETIETVLADPHDAQLLEVDAGLPLLLLSRHAFDVTGEPVEWAQSWYRGDRYKFVTRLRR